jgi:Mlc titration factor MtfA (ptsG expression regulator)
MFNYFKNKRRAKVRAQPVPEEWAGWLDDNFALYTHIPEDDRRELLSHINVFVDEKNFEGCNGLNVTDEMRVTIAGQACLFLLHRKHDYYPSLQSILIYPETFRTETQERDAAGVVTEVVRNLAGQTWSRGSLVLAWNEVVEGGRDLKDGFNVVFHEFAHQLDLEYGTIDGVPSLDSKDEYARWNDTFTNAFNKLRKDLVNGTQTFLNPYGAENPCEFFAVTVENFFENPVGFKVAHPDLYRELSTYFRQDPASWRAP